MRGRVNSHIQSTWKASGQPTDDKHGAGGRLQGDGAHGEHGAPPVDRIREHIEHPDAAPKLNFPIDGRLNLGSLQGGVRTDGPQPLQSLDTFLLASRQDEPAGRLGNEEQGDDHDARDDVDDAQRDQVGRLIGTARGGPVNDGADEGALQAVVSKRAPPTLEPQSSMDPKMNLQRR